MTISLAGATGVSTTSAARGTTSTNVAYTAVAAGRLAVITAAVKPSTATWGSDPTGWTKITDATGGTGTNAADTGTSRIGKWYRVLDGSESGSVTISATGSPSQVCGAMDVYASTLGGWAAPTSVTAADTTHGTNPSAASAAWETGSGLAVGDWLHVGYATDTDDTTAASGHAISQSGTTFGTVTARSRVGNSDGNDGSVFTWDASVSAISTGVGATTMSMTWAASSCGAFGALRIREVAPLTFSQTVVDNFDDNSISGSWDNWGGAQVTESSQRLNVATTTSAGAYWGIQRLNTVDINGIYVGAKLVSAGNQALTTYNAYPHGISFSSGNEVFWAINGNVVRLFTTITSTQTVRVAFPYNAGRHVYFAIGIIGGNVVGVWSTDGVTWVKEFTLSNPFGSTTPRPYFLVGTDGAEASTTTLQVDDYSTFVGIANAAAALSVTATLTTAASTTKPVAAALSATATLTAGAAVDKPVGAALSVTATLAAAAVVVDEGAAALSATATLTAAADVTSAGVTAALAVTATLAAAAVVIDEAAAALAVTATLAAAAIVVDEAAGALAVTATLTAAGSVAKPVAAALSATATLTAAAATAKPVAGALAVTATLTAAALGDRPAAGALQATATLTAAALVTDEAAAALSVTATLAAAASTAKPTAAALAASATLTADATVGAAPVTIAGALAVTATLTAAAAREQFGAAALAVTVTAAAAADRLAAPAAALSATVTLAAGGEVLRSAGAALAAVVTLVAAATAQGAITPRPYAGTTSRPSSGITPRPFAGITERP